MEERALAPHGGFCYFWARLRFVSKSFGRGLVEVWGLVGGWWGLGRVCLGGGRRAMEGLSTSKERPKGKNDLVGAVTHPGSTSSPCVSARSN